MVVLAVDVGADRPADRDVPGAGRHRYEPAERQQHLHQAVQADARVADDDARLGVDGADAVEAGHVEDRAARVLRGVPVRPAEAAGDRAARPARPHRGGRLLVAAGAQQPGGGGGGAAPAAHGRRRAGRCGHGVGSRVGRHEWGRYRLGGHECDRIDLPRPFVGVPTRRPRLGPWRRRAHRPRSGAGTDEPPVNISMNHSPKWVIISVSVALIPVFAFLGRRRVARGLRPVGGADVTEEGWQMQKPSCTDADQRLLAALRDCGTDPRVAAAARALSWAGEHGALWLAAGLAAAAADRDRRGAWLRATALVAAAHLASMGVKRVVRRPRPRLPAAEPLVRTAGRHSFPSSHASSAAAAAVAYGALRPAGRAPRAAAGRRDVRVPPGRRGALPERHRGGRAARRCHRAGRRGLDAQTTRRGAPMTEPGAVLLDETPGRPRPTRRLLALPGGLVRTARPRQWVKNLLVVAAPAAAGRLTSPHVIAQLALVFLLFTAAASAVYLINDARDAEADRAHPDKCHRPVAAGQVPVAAAYAAGADPRRTRPAGRRADLQRDDGHAAHRVRRHAARVLRQAEARPRRRPRRRHHRVPDAGDDRRGRARHPAVPLVPDHRRVRRAVHGLRQAVLRGPPDGGPRRRHPLAPGRVHHRLSALRVAARRRRRGARLLHVGAGERRRVGRFAAALAAAVDGPLHRGDPALRRLRRPGQRGGARGRRPARPRARGHRPGAGSRCTRSRWPTCEQSPGPR